MGGECGAWRAARGWNAHARHREGQSISCQATPYTVLPCDEPGAVAATENPVVDAPVTAGVTAASAEVVGEISTTGVDASVEPNVTATMLPVLASVPVPNVRLPRVIDDPAATTGVGGVVPAGVAAAAVTVEESSGE